jgi:hypothetical protein
MQAKSAERSEKALLGVRSTERSAELTPRAPDAVSACSAVKGNRVEKPAVELVGNHQPLLHSGTTTLDLGVQESLDLSVLKIRNQSTGRVDWFFGKPSPLAP